MNRSRPIPRAARTTRILLWVLAPTALLALAACDRSTPVLDSPVAANPPVVAMAPLASADTEINGLVRNALMADESLRTQDIDVDTSNGEVRLRGAVATQVQKDHARAVAGAVTGVRSVQDELTLKP